MGLCSASVKFVCAAKSLGVDFTDTLMIGRQNLFPTAVALKRVFSILEIDQDAGDFLLKNSFGEPFFSLLGAKAVTSLDYSSYQDATIIHDMNLPVPNELRGRYSVVYDGGTLEHIFNGPQAFKNCMEMVQVGGHFLQVNTANNLMGHGFWQCGPELIFRAFSEANGYRVEAVLLHEVVPSKGWVCRNSFWYSVSDPDAVRQRVELCNSFPTYICTIAKKIADVEIFRQPPQQSDYVTVWNQHSREKAMLPGDPNLGGQNSQMVEQLNWRDDFPHRIKRKLRTIVPAAVKRKLSPFLRRLDPFDRPYFKCIPEEYFLRGQVK